MADAGQRVRAWYGRGLIDYCHVVHDERVERQDTYGAYANVAVQILLQLRCGKAGETRLHGRYLQSNHPAEQKNYDEAGDSGRYVSFLVDSLIPV